MCVLFVEDELLIRSVMIEMLEEAGYQVLGAGTGEEAASLLGARPEVFTALVTDVHMPGALDGIGLAQEARARRPDLPVVVASGRPDAIDRSRTDDLGCLVLTKPYQPRQLITALNQLLRKAGGTT